MYFGFQNISIKYGNKIILDNVNMDFPQGKITTIVGPNGCGKSSLIKMLSKGIKQTAGSAFFLNKNIRNYNQRELAKELAILPQVHDAPPDISIRTLVSYGRFPHRKFGQSLSKKDEEIINSAIRDTGLMQLQNQSMSTLSGGELQRAWIAMTICQEPKVLVLDEPTTYLDICHQVEVLELLKRLNKDKGITVVMVLHDLNLAARYSHYIYAIRDRIVYIHGSPEEVMTSPFVEAVFDIKANIYKDEVNNCPYFIPQKVIK